MLHCAVLKGHKLVNVVFGKVCNASSDWTCGCNQQKQPKLAKTATTMLELSPPYSVKHDAASMYAWGTVDLWCTMHDAGNINDNKSSSYHITCLLHTALAVWAEPCLDTGWVV